MKKQMTRSEEFDILKLVLDKFLWLGVLIMAFGFYRMVTFSENVWFGLVVMLAGAAFMLIFAVLLLKEYHRLQ